MPTLRGIDLSHHNGPGIDFGAIKKSGIGFVGLKATEGASYTDPTFADRRKRAQAVGFSAVLLYHFFLPGADPEAQAIHFANAVGKLAPNEVAVVDVEAADGWDRLSHGQCADAVIAYAYHLKIALGIHAADVMLYGSPGWLRGQFGDELKDLAFMRLWAARYASQLGDVSPWAQATVWQNSDRGTVAGAGAPGTVDTDVWLGPLPGVES